MEEGHDDALRPRREVNGETNVEELNMFIKDVQCAAYCMFVHITLINNLNKIKDITTGIKGLFLNHLPALEITHARLNPNLYFSTYEH